MSNEALSNLLHEERTFPPSEDFSAAAVAKADLYDRAGSDRLGFWAEQADRLSWADALGRRARLGGRRSPSGSSAASSTSRYNCVDRHVEAGHGDKVAIHWEGEPGDTRTITYAELQGRGQPGGQRPDRARHRRRRPGRHLPADDPRGGGRDAGLRPDRRPALGGVRRLLRRRPRVPHRRRRGEGRHHRRRRLPARRAERAQARRRRGLEIERGHERPATCSSSGAPARTWPGPRAATSGGTTPSAARAHEHERRGVRRRAPAVHPLHLGHDRQAEGHPAHHRRLPHPGRRTRIANVFDLKPETDVYWCTADIGWVTGHSYIVYGPLSNGATQVMYEGTPDTPHKARWWELIAKYGVTILYTAPTAIRTFMKWGDQLPAEHDLSSLRLLGIGRRADQPGGVDLVPPGHRRRPHPDRRHLVADRDRRHHDQPAAGRHRGQARLGHAAAARHRRRRGRRPGEAGARRRRWLPGAQRAVAVDAARHLGRRRALQGDLLVALRRTSTSPGTARRRTRTATCGCWAGSTT